MGESLIHNQRGDLPVVIITPSIIESSYKEPFPGWLQGIRMSDPIILAYGKGQIADLWADSQSLMDIIPVDMDLTYQHLCDFPLTTVIDLKPMKFHSSLEGFTYSVFNTIAKHERGDAKSKAALSRKGKRMLNYFVSLARTYEPYTFFQARFDDTNRKRLIQELSVEERKMFESDISGIDWEHYIVNVHLPGLKREFFKKRSH